MTDANHEPVATEHRDEAPTAGLDADPAPAAPGAVQTAGGDGSVSVTAEEHPGEPPVVPEPESHAPDGAQPLSEPGETQTPPPAAGQPAPALDDAELTAVLEALLLVVDTPATVEQLAAATEQPAERIAARLRAMSEELAARDSGIDLREAGGGWRLYTRARYAPYVERLLLDGARSKLTRAALETLAVVAYRQPVTRARVSAVRGVNCDAVMRTLVARGLIREAGVDPDTGATTFATTELFLERLGLSSLAELPDIAPLLPDVDVIDDISESLDDEPHFRKLGGARSADAEADTDGESASSFDVDEDSDD